MNFAEVKSIVIPEGDVFSIARGGEILWKKSRLPLDYQEVKYIESDGNQYIETGYVVDENDVLELRYELTTAKSGDNFLFGSQSLGANEPGLWCETYSSAHKWYARFGYTSSFNRASTEEQRSGVLQLSKGIFAINGEILANPYYSSMPTSTLAIFARRNVENKYVCGYMKCYGFNITRSGDVIRDFVPCYRNSDGEVGMYDLVTETFFENQGTGEFSYG